MLSRSTKTLRFSALQLATQPINRSIDQYASLGKLQINRHSVSHSVSRSISQSAVRYSSAISQPLTYAHTQSTNHRHMTTHPSSRAPLRTKHTLSLAQSISQPLSQPTTRQLTTHPSLGAPLRKKVTITDIAKMHRINEPITMVTAYSYPSAVHVDQAGIDVLLVGDSLAMVELGYDTTLPVTVDAMIHHASAVNRGAERALLVADLPFGSYESSKQQAFQTAVRFLKEAGMDAVKLEGGKARCESVRHLVDNGIAVMGHIGLTPQSISVLGGFRAQGKTYASALQLIDDALALQEAGCFALVIECVPAGVAAAISRALTIPTIGIGAGPHCGGQVLVYHDLLGFFQHAHHAKVAPRFSKTYAQVGQAINQGLQQYKQEVKDRQFPNEQYTPYTMNEKEQVEFNEKLEQDVKALKERRAKNKQSNIQSAIDDSETIKVY